MKMQASWRRKLLKIQRDNGLSNAAMSQLIGMSDRGYGFLVRPSHKWVTEATAAKVVRFLEDNSGCIKPTEAPAPVAPASVNGKELERLRHDLAVARSEVAGLRKLLGWT